MKAYWERVPGFAEYKAADVLRMLEVAFVEPVELDTEFCNGWVIQWRFQNGYGASVVCHEHTRSRPEGAVIKHHEDGTWDLCYDTPITRDVISGLTYASAYEFVASVEALEPCRATDN